MLWIGIIILGVMGLCDLICGVEWKSKPPEQMRIVGWNCNDLIYENSKGQAFEKGNDGRFIPH